jgi:purine nucleosidase
MMRNTVLRNGTWVTGLALSLLFAVMASAQKIKVIVDQDARGPGTSDQQAILVFLQSEKFDVLGITTVSGDEWV